jgi:GDP-D-mannose 3',5'-epimerase
MKTSLVLGAGGFIGGHLVKHLKARGDYVIGVDIKRHEHCDSVADEFIIGDLRDAKVCKIVITPLIDEIYQLAADMGGALFVFTGENDADIMHNSALINVNVCERASKKTKARVFYSSSACIYPERNQLDPNNPVCEESTAYPAEPDSEYGWEKIFSERLYLSFLRNKGLDVRIARFHNIFGPEGTWRGGREKAPAALCRKVAEANDGDTIEVWGPGTQTRSFLYIDECIEGVQKLMNSDFIGPVNIGSQEIISINDLARMVIGISGKELFVKNVPGPMGVMGRCSDNRLIWEKLNWAPSQPLIDGIKLTYDWIEKQVKGNK